MPIAVTKRIIGRYPHADGLGDALSLEEEAGTLPAPYFSPAKEMARVKNRKRKMQRLHYVQTEAATLRTFA